MCLASELGSRARVDDMRTQGIIIYDPLINRKYGTYLQETDKSNIIPLKVIAASRHRWVSCIQSHSLYHHRGS